VCGKRKFKVALFLSSDSHEVTDVGHQEVLVFKSPTSGTVLAPWSWSLTKCVSHVPVLVYDYKKI
jgi:hypothetical protein